MATMPTLRPFRWGIVASFAATGIHTDGVAVFKTIGVAVEGGLGEATGIGCTRGEGGIRHVLEVIAVLARVGGVAADQLGAGAVDFAIFAVQGEADVAPACGAAFHVGEEGGQVEGNTVAMTGKDLAEGEVVIGVVVVGGDETFYSLASVANAAYDGEVVELYAIGTDLDHDVVARPVGELDLGVAVEGALGCAGDADRMGDVETYATLGIAITADAVEVIEHLERGEGRVEAALDGYEVVGMAVALGSEPLEVGLGDVP